MKRILTILLLTSILSVKQSTAQIGIAYYPFQSEIALNTNIEHMIWGDLRIATNTFWGNITKEPILMTNIKRTSTANYYAGLGANFNFFNGFSDNNVVNGYTLHAGARIKPLRSYRNIQCIFELSPYVNPAFDGGLFRTRLGLAYQFTRRKK